MDDIAEKIPDIFKVGLISVYYCILDIVELNLPSILYPHPIHTHKHMQVPLKETLQKRLEYEFHSASYHTILEVVIALKNAAGHLVKVLPAVLVS